MNNRITPYNITELKENEIFVFGSNSNGVHNGNAAATVMKFGAIMGQAVGIQGQTYALPSKHIENLKKHIDDFLLYAEQHPEYIFLFKEAVHIKNINLPLSFWDVLNGGIQARIKQVAEKESPSVSDFCQRTGLSFTILMNILFRKELPTVWIVQKILIAFPSINARWLLLGEGDMKLTKRNSFFTRINDFLHILFASK